MTVETMIEVVVAVAVVGGSGGNDDEGSFFVMPIFMNVYVLFATKESLKTSRNYYVHAWIYLIICTL